MAYLQRLEGRIFGMQESLRCAVELQKILSNRSSRLARLALGGNTRGAWGLPSETFERALESLKEAGVTVVARSPAFRTIPQGPGRQAWFLNEVIVVRASIGPAALLRLAKTIERAAGRRSGIRWGPRPLDIDVLDYGGRRINAGAHATVPGRLVLPHPEIANRGFVLVPLMHVAPHWRHPVSGATARSLLARSPQLARGVMAATPLRSPRAVCRSE